MKKQLRILLAGALVVVPFAITAYVVWWMTTKLGGLGYALLDKLKIAATFKDDVYGNYLIAATGAILVLGGIYLVGLLTRLWLFRQTLGILEKWITHLPGVKTIYESVRDLMKLFGGDSARMGRAVLYKIPQTDISVLGILTNETPMGVNGDGKPKVALFLPFSYMFGGPTIYVSPEHIQETGMSVDQALKLCATAHVGSQPNDAKSSATGGEQKKK